MTKTTTPGGPTRALLAAATLTAALGLALAAAPAAHADVLVLKDGRKLEGKVTIEAGVYRIQMKFGALEFPAKDVVEVIAGEGDPGPAEKPTDPGDDGDGDEGDDGDDDGAGASVEEPEEIDLPSLTPEEKSSLTASLPTGALYIETDHFAIVSTASPDFTKKRAALFEGVRRGFYRYFAKRGFSLKRHPRRLEAVIFADEASFRAFCRREFPRLSQAAAGFYTTQTNRLYFFDRGASPDVLALEKSLEQFEAHLEDIKKKRRQAESNGQKEQARQLSRFYTQELRRYRKFKRGNETFVDDQNETTTVHEAVHQLCYNSDLLIPSDVNPDWLVEGLAMLFEDPAAWRGRHLGADNTERVSTLARHLEKGQQIHLRELIGPNTPLINRRNPGFAYASAWGLVHFFVAGKWRKYKDRFFAYMQAVRAMAEERDGPRADADEARLGLFAEKFGDLAELEGELRAHVEDLAKKAD